MKIHTDNITEADIRAAAAKAGATIESLSHHGSRSKDHAFNVYLSGNSRRRGMHKDYFAATWDQWGVFIAELFDKDENARIGIYSWAGDFVFKTMGRFDWLERDDVPLDHDHRWRYAGIPYHQSCNKPDCDAMQRWQ